MTSALLRIQRQLWQHVGPPPGGSGINPLCYSLLSSDGGWLGIQVLDPQLRPAVVAFLANLDPAEVVVIHDTLPSRSGHGEPDDQFRLTLRHHLCTASARRYHAHWQQFLTSVG